MTRQQEAFWMMTLVAVIAVVAVLILTMRGC